MEHKFREQIALRMPANIKRALETAADKRNITVTKYVLRAIVQELIKEQGDEDKERLYLELI